MADSIRPTSHPAKYSDVLIPIFLDLCRRHRITSILDPMAGVGKIGLLRDRGFLGHIVVNELESEWAEQAINYDPHAEIHVGDAANMTWAANGEFDAVITSPVYGNRLSDHHDAKDESKRYGYRFQLGRKLHPANTGQMYWWGNEYRPAHERIWEECIRVVRSGGLVVVNAKNFFRKFKLVKVSQWHADELKRQGLELIERIRVDTPGLRNGANSELRADGEDVWVFRKGE